MLHILHLVSPVHAFLVTRLGYFSVFMLNFLLNQYEPCSIENHFNQKNPQKTDNRMSLVVLDVECIEIKTVKKLVVH